MSKRIETNVDGFNLEQFNADNPIFDPYVERLNDREVSDNGFCWGCNSEFDKATGKFISEADPNCEEITRQTDLCPRCKKFIRQDGMTFL